MLNSFTVGRLIVQHRNLATGHNDAVRSTVNL